MKNVRQKTRAIFRTTAFAGLSTLIFAGCTATQSRNLEITAASPTVQTNQMPKPNSSAPNQSATPKESQKPINDADYTVTLLNYGKMTQTVLGSQPSDIVNKIGSFDPERLKSLDSSVDLEKKLGQIKKIKIKTADYDLNRDGTMERAILSRGETGEGVEALSIFQSINNQWVEIFVTEGDLDTPTAPKIEILTAADKSVFDLLKQTVVQDADGKQMEVAYYRMQNNRYQRSECYTVVDGVKEAASCD